MKEACPSTTIIKKKKGFLVCLVVFILALAYLWYHHRSDSQSIPASKLTLVSIIRGHYFNVKALSFSPDGKYLASSSGEGTIKLWGVPSGKLIRVFKGTGRADYVSISFSPDGKYLASGSYERVWQVSNGRLIGTVKVWQVSNGRLIGTFKGHLDLVTSVAFSPDGGLLASGSLDKTIKLWQVSDGKLIRTLKGHKGMVWSVSFSPDGKYLASGGGPLDTDIRLWHVVTGKVTKILKWYIDRDYVNWVCFSADSKYLASASNGGSIKVWRVADGSQIKTFKGDSVCFSPDGKCLASATSCDAIELWSIPNWRLVETFRFRRSNQVRFLLFSPDGTYLACVINNTINLLSFSDNKTSDKKTELKQTEEIQTAETKTEFELVIPKGHLDEVRSVAFSPDGRYLASGSRDGTVKLWRIPDGILIKTSHVGGTLYAMAVTPDFRYLATSDSEKIKIWRLTDGTLLRILKGHYDGASCLAFSRNGKYLASASKGIVRLWRMSDGTLLRWLPAEYKISSVIFTPDNKYIVSASRKIKVWRITDGTLVKTFSTSGSPDSISLSPDGRLLAASYGNTIKIWQTSNGGLIKMLKEGDTKFIFSIDFSPDGRYLASGSWSGFRNRTARLWRLSDWHLVKTIKTSCDDLTYWHFLVKFSPDGKYLAGSLASRTIKLWSVPNGKLIRTLKGYSWPVRFVNFSPDGKFLISRDKSLRLWQLSNGTLVKTLKGHSLIFSPDGRYQALVSEGNIIRIVRASDNTLVRVLKGPPGDNIYPVSFSPNGQYLASANEDELRLWHLADGTLLKTLKKTLVLDLYPVAFSPDGRYLAAGPKILRVPDGTVVSVIRESYLKYTCNSLCFSPDGKYLAIGSQAAVALWSLSERTAVRILQKPWNRGSSLTFSPDGKYLAGASGGKTIYLWRIPDGCLVRTIEGHTGRINCVSYSPDGHYIASASDDNTVKLWDPKTGRLKCTFLPLAGGEWIVYTPEMYYNSSFETAGKLVINFLDPEETAFSTIDQFQSKLYRPDIVKRVLRGEAAPPTPKIVRPPDVYLISIREDDIIETTKPYYTLKIRAVEKAKGHVIKYLRVFTNGKMTVEKELNQKSIDNLTVKIPLANAFNRITVQAFNDLGYSSRPISFDVKCKSKEVEKNPLI